jgi:hypothetical protein
MKENFKSFIKKAKASKLSDQEKGLLRSKILEFISYTPIRGKTPILIDRNYLSVFEVKYFMKAASVALICVLAVGGTGVSYVAAKALPGETLYAVKIGINENIEETLATTPKAKLALQSEHIQRRLDEAQKLRKEQKLSPENQKIVIAKIEEHTNLAVKSMNMLEENGDVSTVLETTAKLTPVLEANRDILVNKDKNEKEEGVIEDTSSIVAIVDDSIKMVQEKENSIIASVDIPETNENATSVAMMSVSVEEPLTKVAPPQPTEQEIATQKATSEVKALGRQIEEIVEDRINYTGKKLRELKQTIKDEQALKEKESLVVAEPETTLKTEEVATEKLPQITKTETAEIPSKTILPTESTAKTIESASEQASELIVETKTTTKVPTEFEIILNQIKLAEDILSDATKMSNDKNFKTALILTQQANKIAEEIEARRRLELLELSKTEKIESTMKASVAETTKSN